MEFKVNDGTGFVMNYEVLPHLLPSHTLFIHGNLASNRWWQPSAEIFQAESQGKSYSGSMIMAEFRGAGGSSAPQAESEVDMHRFADDYIALVKSLNLGPINVVGHSTGGLIAALMMAKEPSLFAKGFFLDPVGATGVKFDDSMIAAFDQMKSSKPLVGVVLGSTIHNNNPDSEFFKLLVDDACVAVKSVGHLVLKALDGLDVREDVRQIQKPVLVLHGEHDQLLSMEASKALAHSIPGAKFEIIPGQGHCTNVENPALFVKMLKSFLF